jgi:methyltransferase (TIGR00027 family)
VAAAIRAGHLAFGDSPMIFEDPLAGDLITSRFWSIAANNRMVNWIARHILYRYTRPIEAYALGRARWAEDKLRKALATGIGQYVVLGAGLDSFAFRLPDWAAGVKVYEVDHPATQTAKRRRLAGLGLDMPHHLEFLPADFEKETIADALARSSFSPDQTAFFSWMGTTMYLSPEAAMQTLGAIASVAEAGSELVFDYIIPKELVSPEDFYLFDFSEKFLARRREPLFSLFDPGRFPGEVCGLGFELVENLSPPEQDARYFRGRKDYPRTFSATYFAHFRLREKGDARA